MSFYELNKDERAVLYLEIKNKIEADIISGKYTASLTYFADEDTYIRKAAYIGIGKIFKEKTNLLSEIIQLLEFYFSHPDFKVRQTMINAAGEIGKINFESVEHFFDTGLFDEHHSPRNAVIGSIKKMGEVNPKPVLNWAKKYLHHENFEIRREICHGIELRGRTHPEDILDMLKELEHDQKKRVSSTLIHVLGQIAYKKNCLETVLLHLKSWENSKLVEAAIEEIIDVHYRYRNFSFYTQEEAKESIKKAGF
jgi:HEAT repeat protein